MHQKCDCAPGLGNWTLLPGNGVRVKRHMGVPGGSLGWEENPTSSKNSVLSMKRVGKSALLTSSHQEGPCALGDAILNLTEEMVSEGSQEVRGPLLAGSGRMQGLCL